MESYDDDDEEEEVVNKRGKYMEAVVPTQWMDVKTCH